MSETQIHASQRGHSITYFIKVKPNWDISIQSSEWLKGK